MKLTDEQIEEIRKEFRTIPVDGEGHAIPIEYDEHYVRATVLKLLADRQAWKEEVERLERLVTTLQDVHEFEKAKLRAEINQTVEVLQETKSRIVSMQDESESPSLRYNMGIFAMHKIDEFISSLSQEGEKNLKCDWCDEMVSELSYPHMFDLALGKKMCRGCWDHDREVYKGSYGEDIGEFRPLKEERP